MVTKEEIYELMKKCNIQTNELIDAHINQFEFNPNSVVFVINKTIRVLENSAGKVNYVMTITKKGHVGTEACPNYEKTDRP